MSETGEAQVEIVDYLDVLSERLAVLRSALVAYGAEPDPAVLEGVLSEMAQLRSLAHDGWQRALIEQAQTDKGALAGIGRAGVKDMGGLLAATPGPEDWIH